MRAPEPLEPPLGIGSILYHFFAATFLLVNADHAQSFRVIPNGVDTDEVHDVALITALGDTEQGESLAPEQSRASSGTAGKDSRIHFFR